MILRKQVYHIIAGCSHRFLDGIVIGWSSPVLPKLLDIKQTPFDHVITDSELGILNFLTLSFCLASMTAGSLATKFGRKPVLLGAALTRTLTWFATSLSTTFYGLCFLKLVEAQAVGLAYVVSIMYMSEVVPVNIRGLSLTSLGVSFNLGILLMYSVGPYVSYSVLTTIGSLCGLIASILLMFCEESPTYYMLKGEKQKANDCLAKLNGMSTVIEKDPEQCHIILKLEKKPDRISLVTEFKELFLVKKNLKAFFIALFVFNIPEYSGMMVCYFNMSMIFEKSGSSIPSHIAPMIVVLVQLIPCMASSMLVEKVGRRMLLMTSLAATTVTNCVMGTIFYLDYINSPIIQYISWLPLANMIMFISFYCIGLGSVPSAILGELLDPRVKGLGSSIITGFATASLMGSVALFSMMTSSLGNHTVFWLFSGFCAVGFTFVMTLLPETKGQTFAAIQEMLK